MKEHLVPYIKAKENSYVDEAKTYLEEKIFPDRDIQKFLFLN